MVAGVFLAAGLATFYGLPPLALFISAASLMALLVAVSLSWMTYGRDVLPLSSIFSVFRYMLEKLPMYRKIFSTRSASPWLKTNRSG
jgi:hypothetical protein